MITMDDGGSTSDDFHRPLSGALGHSRNINDTSTTAQCDEFQRRRHLHADEPSVSDGRM
jgi:hypothetical protein